MPVASACAPTPQTAFLRRRLAWHAGLVWAALTALFFHVMRWGLIAAPGPTLFTLLTSSVLAALFGGALWWFWLRPALRNSDAAPAAFLAGVLTGATAIHAFATTWLLMLHDQPLSLRTILHAATSFVCFDPAVRTLLAYFLFTWGLLAVALARFQVRHLQIARL